jgi:hypothetical protein
VTYDGIDSAGDDAAHFDVSDAMVDTNERFLEENVTYLYCGNKNFTCHICESIPE